MKPTEDNVATNDWKVWGYEHMYTNGEAKGLTKTFIDYMLSGDVQDSLVGKLGYQSIKSMKVDRTADGKVTDVK
ncbi:phosphate binding protein [Listeria grayi]|uniref:Phosphate binding protein n=1 Tax=Listeria grayi TaxID=1641 RepID=A0A378MDM4_LISGR|nr:phosphate binding protein [Listeria grayi]